jgi:hypothetical protein
MKIFLKSVVVFCALLVFVAAGCSHLGVGQVSVAAEDEVKELGVYSGYAPTEINILPLSKAENGVIVVYVSMLDSFGSQVKCPAVFRFELYEKVVRSAEPKGRRVAIWPDTDLRGPVENNRHWQDFLRTYKFDLEFKPRKNQNYVLQVTCLCPSGRRLSAETEVVTGG